MQFILFFIPSWCNSSYSANRPDVNKWINSAHQAAATTFAFSSVFIFLLWKREISEPRWRLYIVCTVHWNLKFSQTVCFTTKTKIWHRRGCQLKKVKHKKTSTQSPIKSSQTSLFGLKTCKVQAYVPPLCPHSCTGGCSWLHNNLSASM